MTLIQAHLPVCQFAERHRLLVTAHPADLLDAVTLPGTIDDAWVKRLISWRELPGRFLSRFGSKNALGRRAAFGIGDFTLLGREDDLEIAFGLAGRFWRFDYGLVPLRGPEEFDAMSTAGVPKLVLTSRSKHRQRAGRGYVPRPAFIAMIEAPIFDFCLIGA